jgi:hypothetical protein
MKTAIAYKCDFCNMVSIYKSSVLRHEKMYCRKNPDRQFCHNCKDVNICLDYIDDSPYETNNCDEFNKKSK